MLQKALEVYLFSERLCFSNSSHDIKVAKILVIRSNME